VRPRSPCTNSLMYVPAYIKQCVTIFFLKSIRTKSKGMVRQGGMKHNLSDTDKF
jgi:hypothetical protein